MQKFLRRIVDEFLTLFFDESKKNMQKKLWKSRLLKISPDLLECCKIIHSEQN